VRESEGKRKGEEEKAGGREESFHGEWGDGGWTKGRR
jgi:hypothetical protein